MIVNIQCGFCEKHLEVKEFPSKKAAKYCNRKCMANGFLKPLIKKNCETCGIEFCGKESKHRKRRFCSHKCIRINIEKLKAYKPVSFWRTATWEQKLERYKEMFEEKVIKKEGCWGWKSFINSTGCGMMGPNGHILSAYRASWLIHKGEILEGLKVLHKCHNRVCSNPEHLYIGTCKDNTRDMIEAGRGKFNQQNSKNTKLNLEQAREIKKLLVEGLTWKSIAEKFGVSQGTVQDIKRNRMWRNA